MEIPAVDITWKSFWGNKPWFQRLATLVAIGLAVFQIYTALFGSLDALKQRAIHLGLGLILVYLIHVSNKKKDVQARPNWLDWLSAGTTFVMIAYLLARYEWITVERFTLITPLAWYEKVLGITAIILVVEGARRAVSRGLFYVVIGFLLYPFVGPYLPGALQTARIGWTDLVDFNYLSLGGIFGIPLGISATEITLFVLFGVILMRSGGSFLINNIATIFAGGMVGGPAKVAVVGSSLFGTISGSGTANVATVGSVTIPMMKRAGYSPKFAAAVEATASTGGQIMPPVMGAAAFVMSGFSGIPYITICRYAIFPAILYYLSLFITVDLEARRLKLSSLATEVSLGKTLKDYGHMILPIGVLVTLLIIGYTPRLAGGLGIVAAIGACQLRRKTRLGFVGVLAALEDGARGMLIIVASTAAAGIIVGSVDLTGLGHRLSSAFLDLSGGHLLLALILAMLIALLLGLGLPTTPAYIVQAATVIPALITMGLPPFVAHLFAFYYSCLAIITPPDASAAYAAASIAGSDGWKTGWLATRLAIVAFIVPFMFAYNQALLLVGPWWEISIAVLTACAGVFCLSAALEGYLFLPLNFLERLIAGAAALLLIYPSLTLALPGGVGLIYLLIKQYRCRLKRQLETFSMPIDIKALGTTKDDK